MDLNRKGEERHKSPPVKLVKILKIFILQNKFQLMHHHVRVTVMDLGLYSEWTRFGRRLQQEMSCLNICGFLQSLQDSIRIVSQLDNHRILLNHFQFIVILPLDRTLFQRLTVPQIKKKIKPFPDMSVGDATLQLPLFLILTLDGGEWLS